MAKEHKIKYDSEARTTFAEVSDSASVLLRTLSALLNALLKTSPHPLPHHTQFL